MRSTPTTILAIDTSTRWVGIALYDGSQYLCEHTWLSQDFHTVELSPMVHQAFERSGIGMNQLGAVAVACGPGSFTGLRVGLALAKGIALAASIPLVGVPTLDILASAQPLRMFPMAAVLRAGRNRLALRWYRLQENTWKPYGDYEVRTAAELASQIQQPTWVCGELTAEERSQLSTNSEVRLASPLECLRRPAILAEIGWKRWQEGQTDDPSSLTPFYLHYHEPIPS